MDDLDLNIDLDSNEVESNRTEQRVKKVLADKDEALKKAQEATEAQKKAEEAAALAQKDLDFFKNFSTLSPKYQNAAEYQDKIKEKVTAGYEVEDAIISVLNKEGKFIPPQVPETPKDSPAGGSATNAITAAGEKPLGEMNREELRSKLQEPDNAKALDHLLGRS